MKEFNEMLECCIDETDSDGLNLKIKFKERFKPFLEFFRTDRESFYKKYDYVNFDGIDLHNLTDGEAFCIYSYTTSYSSWINGDIRNKKKMSICKELYAQYLDKSLDKIPNYNNKYAFRIDTHSEYLKHNWEKVVVGDIIQIHHYLSTFQEYFSEDSIEKNSLVWSITTLELNSKARDISNVTNHNYEKEILFKRNSFFKVEKINISKRVIDLIEVEIPTFI